MDLWWKGKISPMINHAAQVCKWQLRSLIIMPEWEYSSKLYLTWKSLCYIFELCWVNNTTTRLVSKLQYINIAHIHILISAWWPCSPLCSVWESILPEKTKTFDDNEMVVVKQHAQGQRVGFIFQSYIIDLTDLNLQKKRRPTSTTIYWTVTRSNIRLNNVW